MVINENAIKAKTNHVIYVNKSMQNEQIPATIK